MPKYYIDFECWVAEAETADKAEIKVRQALMLKRPKITGVEEVVDGDIIEYLGEEK